MYYEELEELFDHLSDSQKFRLVCRFILKLPTEQIACIENKRRNAITISFQKAEQKLLKIRTHQDLISAIQILFTDI